MAGTESDAAILDNTLRWEGLAAVAETRRAETQMAPMIELDTWALAAQMQAFVADGGAGGTLFGTHQAAVRGVTDEFATGAQALAERLLASGEFSTYQRFVAGYAAEYPLQDLRFARPSVIELWSHQQGKDTRLVDSLGTIPEAMSDMAQRMQIYAETTPQQVVRRTQLALRDSGYAQGDVRTQLLRLDRAAGASDGGGGVRAAAATRKRGGGAAQRARRCRPDRGLRAGDGRDAAHRARRAVRRHSDRARGDRRGGGRAAQGTRRRRYRTSPHRG